MLARFLLALELATLAACSARGEAGEERGVGLPDVPDDLLAVPDPLHPQRTVSLRDGTVVGALTTAPSASGEPAALVYRCQPDAAGAHRWKLFPEGGLAPLGGPFPHGIGALHVSALADVAGEVDAQAESPNEASAPLYRYRRSRGLYVLRLETRGGLGPDEGAACTAGSADQRSAISADFYFVALPGYR